MNPRTAKFRQPDRPLFEDTTRTPALILRAWDDDGDTDPVADLSDLAGLVRSQDNDW